MKKYLFVDRDGTLIYEAPPTYQIDSFEKLAFYKGVFIYLSKIVKELDYELVMVSNQDGLGTSAYNENDFNAIQNFILKHFQQEGIEFKEILIDKSTAEENLPTRKPNVGMLQHFINNPDVDLKNSFVIGDRISDIQLAKNLSAKAIWLNNENISDDENAKEVIHTLNETIALQTNSWEEIYQFLRGGIRSTTIERNTNETKIKIDLVLDGSGKSEIKTGLEFFDHMLDQLAKHGGMDLKINVEGDLQVDEHHTIEDTAIALGEAFHQCLGDKMAITRYGFLLPMDDCLAQVAIDFGGRSWLVWKAKFKREKIGDVPTEMFYHFFKSFTDASKCNLNIKARGKNEHHKIEAVFKAFAKAIRMAVKRDFNNWQLPTTKGVI